MRVGRFGDACIRIQNSGVEDVDHIASMTYEGNIKKVSDEISKELASSKAEA